MLLIRFQCQCVALPTPFGGLHFVIRSCAGEADSRVPHWRALSDPEKAVPVAEGEARVLLDDLAALAGLGDRYEELRSNFRRMLG